MYPGREKLHTVTRLSKICILYGLSGITLCFIYLVLVYMYISFENSTSLNEAQMDSSVFRYSQDTGCRRSQMIFLKYTEPAQIIVQKRLIRITGVSVCICFEILEAMRYEEILWKTISRISKLIFKICQTF